MKHPVRPGFHARPVADHSARAVRDAGNAAYGALCRAAAWSAEHWTDGFLSTAQAHRFGPPRSWERLVATGLVLQAGDGYRIAGFGDGNPRAADLRLERAAISEVRRRAGRSGGLQSGVSRRSKPKQNASGDVANMSESFGTDEAKRSKPRRAGVGDPARRAVARGILAPDDAAAWRLWEAMQRIPALLAAEDADASVAPGSLARLAGGLARRLQARRAPPEVWLDVVAHLGVLLDDAAAWGVSPPPMAAVSRRVAALLAELLPEPERRAEARP